MALIATWSNTGLAVRTGSHPAAGQPSRKAAMASSVQNTPSPRTRLQTAPHTNAPSRQRDRARVKHACTARSVRSEEHTSELQSHSELVCRLLLEKQWST